MDSGNGLMWASTAQSPNLCEKVTSTVLHFLHSKDHYESNSVPAFSSTKSTALFCFILDFVSIEHRLICSIASQMMVMDRGIMQM